MRSALAISTLSFLLLVGCSSTSSAPAADAAPLDVGDAGLDADRDAAPVVDAAAPDAAVLDAAAPDASLCAITRAYVTRCGGDLTCGSKFDAWCTANDEAINSEAFRQAEASCLSGPGCDPDVRKDCDYRAYQSATPTAEQRALAAEYCATCAPGDGACAARVAAYDPAAGPSAVNDVFIAVWELGDPLTRDIRTTCTGASLDGGTPVDASCASLFASCAGGVYIERLPDCP